MISIQSLREPTRNLSSAQLATLCALLHEARETIPVAPWRTHACLDEIATMLGAPPMPRRTPSLQLVPRLTEAANLPDGGLETGATCIKGGLAPWQIFRVRRHIDAHIDAPLPIEQLADLVQLSSGHFCRAFKASLGEPPHAYITRRRIRHAQHLMMTTTDTLGTISIACGLADQAHLTRLFRKLVGTTPLTWRRARQQG
ncbi:helix-turn-helix domain-containing protein [Novosphingobium sp. FSW06-99]|uniref:helix-turn-helix domain-containing protein n=1 Tax=Novosphingobium sp. FSW06-99 TaxID=1739113 RepID=UPI00076D2F71|nr:AraC family transcriptional regulator [Novosphingobium sp. FSW06-99]KUR74855.1 hypothetical protein AQZ49_16430 [Novosphingobium sp. FSW06-99]